MQTETCISKQPAFGGLGRCRVADALTTDERDSAGQPYPDKSALRRRPRRNPESLAPTHVIRRPLCLEEAWKTGV